MLLHHLQRLLDDEAIEIVVDNAKSHVSKHHGLKRSNSEPLVTSAKKAHRSRHLNRRSSDPSKRLNRWESQAHPLKNNFASTFTNEASTHSHNHLPQHPTVVGKSLHTVLSKPVRRHSIEDPDILAELHDSLSSIEGLNDTTQDTAVLLAKVLERFNLYDECIY